MSNNDNMSKEAKDGFDLIEYPCVYQFKAMVRIASLADTESAQQLVSSVILEALGLNELLKVSSNVSRAGNFESVSATAPLNSREQLEAVYQALAKNEKILMTL